MKMIERCCYHKQLEGLIDECAENKSAAHFFSYSDWDLCDLLDIVSRYCVGGIIGLVMVRLDVKLLAKIKNLLLSEYPNPKSAGNHIPAVKKMILVSQPEGDDMKNEIKAQLGQFIRSGRLVVCEDNVGFRCLAAKGESHSLVIQGSLNTQHSGAMQMFTLTASPQEYENVAEMIRVKEHTKSIFKSIQ